MHSTQPTRKNRSYRPKETPSNPQNPNTYPGYQNYAPAPYPPATQPPRPSRRRNRANLGCILPVVLVCGIVGFVLAVYLLFPANTIILLLGMDYADPWLTIARTDTMIMSRFNPWKPYVGMLSIPRDLWVTIPGIGENRINTAHFFAEANQTGSGPFAAMDTIQANFGIRPKYYIRLRFETFKDIFNAMGGVDIVLEEPTAGYDAGKHHLSGNKALAFARNRSGSDDFFRMEQGQMIIKAALKQMLSPLKWPRIPAVLIALSRSIDTNIPFWIWPRLGVAVLRVGPDGIDNRTIGREMVTPFFTDQGANVLSPNWGLINLVVDEMFGR